MPATVILLPCAGQVDRGALGTALGRRDVRLVAIDLPIADAAPFATRVCAAIVAARPAAPILLVAPPISAPHLPAIALAQRSAHRRVAGYVILEAGLLDAASAPSGADWPDAPVACLSLESPEPAWVRLRGWHGQQVSTTANAAALIADWAEAESLPGAYPIDDLR